MFSVLASEDFPSEVNGDGYVFVDRDSRWFGLILDYLREGTVLLPRSAVQRNAVRREAEYYGIEGLCKAARTQTWFAAVGGDAVAIYSVDSRAWDLHVMPRGWRPATCCGIGGFLCVAAMRPYEEELHCHDESDASDHHNTAGPPDGASGNDSDDGDESAASHGLFYAKAIHRLDPGTGRWSYVATVPVPLRNPRLHHVAGRLVASGLDLFTDDEFVYAWDFVQKRWHPVQTPSVGFAFTSCEIRGRWYVFGDSELFSPACQSAPVADVFASPPGGAPAVWTALPDMPTPRWDTTVVGFNGKAVVLSCGCSESSDVVELYDPETGGWATPPPLPRRLVMGRVAAAVVEDAVVVMGCAERGAWAMDMYSAALGRWVQMAVAEPPCGRPTCCCFL